MKPLFPGPVLVLSLLFSNCSRAAETEASFQIARLQMVQEQIAARGVTNRLVLAAMRTVPRHQFVPESQQRFAYRDHPLPIGHDQTISQPYIVAFMTELLALKPGQNVLEIGTGSGYQAAILAAITTNVYTIEIVRPLYEEAKARLTAQGMDAARIRLGDGYQGWKEHAPFDAIIVTAAPDHIPKPLIDQLKPGGRMVIPVGPVYSIQELQVIEKTASGEIRKRSVAPVRFVPLTREERKK
jgi:protein-L-isoaspartate(D-aspartate) O-methyltransferase